jgi:hypothetical protein
MPLTYGAADKFGPKDAKAAIEGAERFVAETQRRLKV